MAVPLLRDLGLKVFATALAVLLWLTVAGDPIAERGLHVPLGFENIPDSMVILGGAPETVEVRVRGSSAVLRRLEVGEVAAIIDLGSQRPGNRLFDMTADQIQAPLGIEVTRVIPASVSLTLAVDGSPVTVPIVPLVVGEPAPGFVVGRIVAEPGTVRVIGPRSLLRQLTEATTEPLDVTNQSVPIDAMLTVGVSDPNLRLETPRAALVAVEIVRAPVDGRLEEVPVRIRNLASGLSATVTPASVTVTVHGSPELMRGLDNNAIGAFVDLTGHGAGTYHLSVTVEPHRAFRVIQSEPTVVQVDIR